MIKILILFAMIFCHIVDDYYLQGWLASAKQKKYWEENAPDEMYKNDYKMALFMHSFSWSFMIMLVPIIYALFVGLNGEILFWYVYYFVWNLCFHMWMDNNKANKKECNLIQDQIFHLSQIAITWLCYVVLMI